MPKYRINDHVRSNSGLTYIVLSVHALDAHGSFAYTVRRLRGGKLYGPLRKIAECGLFPETSPFTYNESEMFPFSTSFHTTTD